MKSLMTMWRVARAYAVGQGIRIWEGVRCGFFLTMWELQELYTSQGFNRKGTAMRRHMQTWMAEDLAVLEGSEWDPKAAVWFPCPEGMETVVMVRSEQCGGRYVTEIRRTEWPALRRMHGIQEAIA